MGFLGVGKTTAILQCLQQKPDHEKWAVLVNEAGAVGIDGAIIADQGATVKQIPGGCLCCAAGLPFEVAVNRLLAEARPDRLLIEPSGLGHPLRLLAQLGSGFFKTVLDVRASICLVDPRKLADRRYTEHKTFIDQITLADVLVANKIDLADEHDIQLFKQLAQDSQPAKAVVSQTRLGQLNPAWLDVNKNPHRNARHPHAHRLPIVHKNKPATSNHTPWQRQENQADAYHTCGWVFPEDILFDYNKLKDWLSTSQIERVKGILITERGCFVFNLSDNLLSIKHATSNEENRIELIDLKACWEQAEKDLVGCINV